jgi:hypothetical protein
MEVQKSDLKWLMDKVDSCSQRYVESENFMLDILNMNFFQCLFIRKKALNFLKERKKYNF